MNFLYQQRGTGKTSNLIKLSASTGIPIATYGITAVANIKDKAKHEFGIENLPEPFVASKEACTAAGEYFIDEGGYVLKHLLGGEPLLITASDSCDFVEGFIGKYLCNRKGTKQ